LPGTSYDDELYNVGFTYEEMQELVFLINDEPVNEDFLKGIKLKLKNRMKRVRRRVNGTAAG
jgi:hypothetical protein